MAVEREWKHLDYLERDNDGDVVVDDVAVNCSNNAVIIMLSSAEGAANKNWRQQKFKSCIEKYFIMWLN